MQDGAVMKKLHMKSHCVMNIGASGKRRNQMNVIVAITFSLFSARLNNSIYGCRLFDYESMVGARGFEPPTTCTPYRCATWLRYAPTLWLSYVFRLPVKFVLSCSHEQSHSHTFRFNSQGDSRQCLFSTPEVALSTPVWKTRMLAAIIFC